MEKWILFFSFCCLHNISRSQQFYTNIPADQTLSTAAIAGYINKNFDSDHNKAAAIYNWVASNIKYDDDSSNNINLGADPEAKVTAALRRRKGVCENFAAIFNDICLKAGLVSFVVDGYTQQGGVVDKTGHSWAAIFLDKQWQLCDPTWDVGGSTKWFCLPPSVMINTHMPYDPLWQLLEYPVSHRQFAGGLYNSKNQPPFNYSDSIAAYIKMDSLQRFISTAYRIQQSGLHNKLVKGRLDYNKMHIEIIREDKDVDLYNAAVANLNDATNIYNEFVVYRNKQFKPEITDKAMGGLLEGIDGKLTQAHTMLNEIDRSAAVFKFSTEELRNKLNRLAVRVKDQNDFLRKYLSTATDSRHSLFYTSQGIAGK